jgi:hypothetical protein
VPRAPPSCRAPSAHRPPAALQATDNATISAAVKAELRDELVVLSKRVVEAAKAAAAANKQLAVSSAVATADLAAEAGSGAVVAQLEVGSDLKALSEAWYAISAKHPGLAAMLISVDAEKDKVRGRRWLGRDELPRGMGGWGQGEQGEQEALCSVHCALRVPRAECWPSAGGWGLRIACLSPARLLL